jgi:hypothetical protein
MLATAASASARRHGYDVLSIGVLGDWSMHLVTREASAL